MIATHLASVRNFLTPGKKKNKQTAAQNEETAAGVLRFTTDQILEHYLVPNPELSGGKESRPARRACSAPGCSKKTQEMCNAAACRAHTVTLKMKGGVTKDHSGRFFCKDCIKDHQREVSDLLTG